MYVPAGSCFTPMTPSLASGACPASVTGLPMAAGTGLDRAFLRVSSRARRFHCAGRQRPGATPSPAVLRSNAVVEPLEERGRAGRCATAAGVEREKHPSEGPRHLWGKVARLASREDLLVPTFSRDTEGVAVRLSLDHERYRSRLDGDPHHVCDQAADPLAHDNPALAVLPRDQQIIMM